MSTGYIGGNDVHVSTWDIGLDLAAPFSGLIEDNAFHGGYVGIYYGAPAALSANRIYDNNYAGVIATVPGTTDGFGFVGDTQPNDIYQNYQGVELDGGQMQNQYIHDNYYYGVTGSGMLVCNDLDHANLIANDNTGVSINGPVEFNRITGNYVGIYAVSGQLVARNLIYRNTSMGLMIEFQNDVRVFNNTFFAPTSTQVYEATPANIFVGGSSQVEIRNNILWAENGFDIYVNSDGTSGYFSDYNDLYSSGTGEIVYWGGQVFNDLSVWQQASLLFEGQQSFPAFDLHSIGTSAVDPSSSQPRFLDPTRDDFRVLNQGSTSSSPVRRSTLATPWRTRLCRRVPTTC